MIPVNQRDFVQMNQSIQQREHQLQQQNNIRRLSVPTQLATVPSTLFSQTPTITSVGCSGISTLTERKHLSDPTSTSCMASILAAPSKQRAESFLIEEVRVMLHEIGLRKQILLSLSPSTNRLKRRAWEEVAGSMAARWPHSPRRTADQVKKKWENLVSKTKRKLRAGHMTPEFDWNETNSIVMEFLTQHSPLLQFRYANARAALENPSTGQYPPFPVCAISGPTSIFTRFNSKPNTEPISFPSPLTSLVSSHCATSTSADTYPQATRASPDTDMRDVKCELLLFGNSAESPSSATTEQHQQTSTVPTAVSELQNKDSQESRPMETVRSEIINSFSSTYVPCLSAPSSHSSGIKLNCLDSTTTTSFGPLHQSLMNLAPIGPNLESTLQTQLLNQLTKEHQIRVDILTLQKRAWELQVELLQIELNRSKKHELSQNTETCSGSTNNNTEVTNLSQFTKRD
ncbi:Leucine-rich repeat-containing protein (LRR) [Paragonimus heterotremus]|uniref:Leucine-rich repeat-containing protein (LRR) n=1 Tax=Paragonimus heterotremus TaxID=100268 RepID=A0A8J4TAE5_9TREM|nr:Leucine-rich repeat-containing protein (LRR) [Paragonimus heterotremus]